MLVCYARGRHNAHIIIVSRSIPDILVQRLFLFAAPFLFDYGPANAAGGLGGCIFNSSIVDGLLRFGRQMVLTVTAFDSCVGTTRTWS